MTDAADLIQQVMASPWVYLALFALAALDSVLPVIPGEAALVTAAVFATSGDLNLLVIVLAGTAGAFAGDHLTYLIGRNSIGRLQARIRRRPRGRAAFDWATTTLAERGGQALLTSRWVPGVRTATTITMGGVGYPLRSFSLFDAAGAALWATSWSLMGYLGGAAFGTDPLKGLLFGLGLAAALMLLSGAVRHVRRRIIAARKPVNADQRSELPELSERV
ncbi:DedA family protein [Saccharopolyspora indica]|uniref:DedA family protein n=1 Tax=Saccharopolyspora indica TaxID=1229659 RepID=UPI0022EA3C53|nr:DedA family protein [Saccharopolyspora indica]MDA3649077.1 DedA family protein [Saccharopolyspora indica]